jgi:hypothetical protein
MNYSLGNILGGGMVAGLDPDAKSYINAVVATGATVTQTQKNAINAFIESEKAASRYSSIKRLYLPIWGAAAANAIDMITRASGTFVNSPTHGSGFVKGNGTTSYFTINASPASAGFTTTNGRIFSLVKTSDSRIDARVYIGAGDSDATGSGDCRVYQSAAVSVSALIGRVPATPVASVTVVARNGIFVANRNSSQGLILHRRITSGVTRSSAATATGAVASQNFIAMGIQYSATRTFFSDAELGVYGIGTGLSSDAEVDAFSLNLKTLWETCTGLTLP